ncbi:MAG TPA: hypothetical protein VF469_00740 [Kofleriaceae bacterium]
MPLLWIPIHSIAKWTAPPAGPRVTRAAITGQGWLVATEVAGGWSTTFVPDPGAADPPDADEAATVEFQIAKVDWGHSAIASYTATRPNLQKTEGAPPAHGKSTKDRNR